MADQEFTPQIEALTDFERKGALYYLAGYAPDALQSALDSAATIRAIQARNHALDWFDTQVTADRANSGPTEGIDFEITSEETADADLAETWRYVGTCNACGTETQWCRSYDQAQNLMAEHVTREWMSH